MPLDAHLQLIKRWNFGEISHSTKHHRRRWEFLVIIAHFMTKNYEMACVNLNMDKLSHKCTGTARRRRGEPRYTSVYNCKIILRVLLVSHMLFAAVSIKSLLNEIVTLNIPSHRERRFSHSRNLIRKTLDTSRKSLNCTFWHLSEAPVPDFLWSRFVVRSRPPTFPFVNLAESIGNRGFYE